MSSILASNIVTFLVMGVAITLFLVGIGKLLGEMDSYSGAE